MDDRLVAIVVLAAVAQWLLFALVSLLSRARQPKSGMRLSERLLLGSSAVLGLVWIAYAAMTTDFGPSKPVQASVVATGTSNGSCATVERGMTADAARRKIGAEPDEVRSEETIRGPKAEAWIYRNARCAVHLVGGKVEFIE